MNILDKIVVHKKEEIKRGKKQYPLQFFLDLIAGGTPPTRDFSGCLNQSAHIAVIAELKFASPSRGVINKRENLVKIIQTYETGGAKALSVLTEGNFFQGEPDDIHKVKKISSLPILRKDFIINLWQVYESRCLGADAILLIVSILSDEELKKFLIVAEILGMQCLVEVHDKQEVERAIKAGASIIGINNRDLKTFNVDLKTTEKLMDYIPYDRAVVSESGIRNREDMEYLRKLGVDGVLIGETFMKAPSIVDKVNELKR